MFGLGGKGLVAAGGGAAKDQLHAVLRLGGNELQPLFELVHFVVLDLRLFQIHRKFRRGLPGGILPADRAL